LPYPPNPPGNFRGTVQGATSIKWEWNDLTDEEGYRVHDGLHTNLSGDLPANRLYWTETGLTPNTQYLRHVHAFIGEAVSDASNEAEVYTQAAVPPAPTVDNPGFTTLAVTVNPGDNPSPTQFAIYNDTSKYYVNATGGSNGSNPVWRTVAEWGTVTVTGLTPGTSYTFKTRAKHIGYTGYTGFGAGATAETLAKPAAPANFRGTVLSSNSINWAWDDVANEDGYRVHNNAQVNISGDLAAGTLSWTESGLTPNTQYLRHVHAFNGGGESDASGTVSYYTFAVVPPAPTVGGATSSSLNVSVSSGDNPAGTLLAIYNDTAGYYVDATGGSKGGTPVWRTAAEWGTVTITGLAPETNYNFKVKARNGDAVETVWGAPGSGTTLALPPLVSSITPTLGLNNGVLNVTIAGANFKTGAAVKLTKSGQSDINGSNVVVGSSSQITADVDLSGKVVGQWNLVVSNADGQSGTLVNGFTIEQLPAAPSTLNLTVVSQTQINLSWTDNATNEQGFKIERKTGAGGSYAEIATVGANTTAYNDTALTANTTYYYRIKAYNAGGESAYCDEANATTLPNPPEAPSGLTATAVSQTQINLAWTDNATNEQGFKIERKTGAGGSYAEIATVGENLTTYNDTTLTADTTYYYRVRAYNAGGESAYCDEANATTLPNISPPSAPTNLNGTANKIQVTLNWNPSAPGSYPIAGYRIKRSNTYAGPYTQIGTSPTNSYLDTAVLPGATYYYLVSAYDNQTPPNESANSSPTTVTLPPKPQINNLSTHTAVNSSDSTVTITGQHFSGSNLKVYLWDGNGTLEENGIELTVISISDNEIIILFPAGISTYNGNLYIVTDDGTSEVNAETNFAITYHPPVLESLIPEEALSGAQISITLTGRYLQNGAQVKLERAGEQSLTSEVPPQVTPPSRLVGSFNLSNAASGEWDIVVTNPDGQEGRLSGAITIKPPLPEIINLTPSEGDNSYAVPLTIAGNYFAGASQVKLGNNLLSFNLLNDNLITATVPAGLNPNIYPVSVHSASGWSAVHNKSRFNVTGSPWLNIWPGDLDNSGQSDLYDVLLLGVYWHNTGLARSEPSYTWVAQQAPRWTIPEATFIDADGNGIIDENDLIPLELNFELMHN
jgi:fibronectin type 3 domain-containing protein